jgi:comEA protein
MLIFTPAEKRAILITVLILLSACVYQIVNAYKPNPYTLDYKKQDSLFARVNAQPVYHVNEQVHTLSFKTLTEEKMNQNSALQIDLNTASKEELQTLPRVGPAMASRILEYRRVHRRFKTNEELMKIKGIGKKTFAKIKPYLADIR